jgi:hypothetical protein
MFRAMFGSGGTDSDIMPPEIQEIDVIVCRAETKLRAVLIQVYTRDGTMVDKSLVLGITIGKLKYRLNKAEWHVNGELDAPAIQVRYPELKFDNCAANPYTSSQDAFFAPQRIVSVRYFVWFGPRAVVQLP